MTDNQPKPYEFFDTEDSEWAYLDIDGNIHICDGGQSCDGSCPGWG